MPKRSVASVLRSFLRKRRPVRRRRRRGGCNMPMVSGAGYSGGNNPALYQYYADMAAQGSGLVGGARRRRPGRPRRVGRPRRRRYGGAGDEMANEWECFPNPTVQGAQVCRRRKKPEGLQALEMAAKAYAVAKESLIKSQEKRAKKKSDLDAVADLVKKAMTEKKLDKLDASSLSREFDNFLGINYGK